MPELFRSIAVAWSEHIGISERRALCVLAYIDESVADRQWSQLTHDHRERLILAYRRAIELGAVCAEAVCADAQHPSRPPTIEEAARLLAARAALKGGTR